MKQFRFLVIAVALLFAAPLFVTSGCSATNQTVAYRTLGVVGASADSAMKTATSMLKNGTITVAQWQKAADIHDKQFQPAYNLALASVQANLNSIASPELQGLADQLAALILSFQKTTP